MEFIRKILFFDVFPFICRLLACILLALSLYGIGFPPPQVIGSTPVVMAIFGVFLLLLPIAKKVSFARIISFEREIEKAKEEAKEFRTETTQLLSTYSSMISAISNTVKQTVNVNFHPGREELKKAKEALEDEISSPKKADELTSKTDEFVAASGNDYNFALARLRMEIERVLREALGKRTITTDPTEIKGGFLSARQLFREFIRRHPKYEKMHYSFDYILKVCNAAIHGQQVSESHAQEAIQMGLIMIEEILRAIE